MQVRFGKQEFSFFPRTFVLPQDMKLLRKAWEDGGSRQKWIIKPVRSARRSSLCHFTGDCQRCGGKAVSTKGQEHAEER